MDFCKSSAHFVRHKRQENNNRVSHMLAHTLFTSASRLSRLFLGGRGRFFGQMAVLWTILYWVGPSPPLYLQWRRCNAESVLHYSGLPIRTHTLPVVQGKKEFNFQRQKARGVRAGPEYSNEVCKNALWTLMTPYRHYFCHCQEKSKKKLSCTCTQQECLACNHAAHYS